MKKNSALWGIVIVLAIVVVGGAVYFGNSKTQKGTFTIGTGTGLRVDKLRPDSFSFYTFRGQYPFYNFFSPDIHAGNILRIDAVYRDDRVVKTVCTVNNQSDGYSCEWDGTDSLGNGVLNGWYKFKLYKDGVNVRTSPEFLVFPQDGA